MKLAYLAFGFVSLTCNAQSVQYSNQYGQPIGSSLTTGTTTIYSNQYGQPVATAIAQPTLLQTASMPTMQPMMSLPVLQPLPTLLPLPILGQ